jgi:hypothetical protein
MDSIDEVALRLDLEDIKQHIFPRPISRTNLSSNTGIKITNPSLTQRQS